MMAIGSALRMLKIALPLALILGLGLWGWIGQRNTRIANEALGAERMAHRATAASLELALKTITAQNAKVQQLADEGKHRTEAARIALGAAVAKEKRAGEAMVRIDLGRVQRAPVAACATSEAVMAAREFL